MPQKQQVPIRHDGFTRLDSSIKKSLENGPLKVTVSYTSDDFVTGDLLHLDRYTVLLVDPSRNVLQISKHAIRAIHYHDPIAAGLTEYAAEKTRDR